MRVPREGRAERARAQATIRHAAPHPAARAALALQRTAGNAATTRILQRRNVVDKALDWVFGPPEDVWWPESAKALKGRAREVATEENHAAYWERPGRAAQALDKL